MSKIREVLRYFTLQYPYKDELSKARLTKMVYLADWYSSKENGRQITKIKWYFDHYGPYVSDVYEEANKDKYLNIKQTYTMFGSPKEVIEFKYKNDLVPKLSLDKDEIKILDKVINETKQLTWNAFIDKVYSTYPIQKQNRYTTLNLIRLAKEENN